LGLLVLTATHGAWAFCNAMSCDPSDASQHCQTDAKTHCVLSGSPLFWGSDCVTFSIQKTVAPGAGIDYAAAQASLERAFDAWTSADCDGKSPSLRFTLSAPVSCDASEYNKDHRNANILIFREDAWPYEGGEDALGLTRVRFDADDDVGALYDADIEINAVSEPLSIGDPKADEVDLDSLITHELGHALGLGHSLNLQATMIAGYEKGSISLRSLDADDMAGVCNIYPPGRAAPSSSCEPRHGFSELCGADQPASEPPLPLEPHQEPPSEAPSSSCSVLGGAAAGSGCSSFVCAALGLSLFRRRAQRRAAAWG
jgi:hypothetical protein